MTRLQNIAIASFVLFATGCQPCDCEEATVVGIPEVTVQIRFDESVLPWADDEFTITVIRGASATTVSGTYEESGDTIRFDADGAIPILSLRSGEVNAIACDQPRPGWFTVTPPGAAGATVPIVLQCTKRG